METNNRTSAKSGNVLATGVAILVTSFATPFLLMLFIPGQQSSVLMLIPEFKSRTSFFLTLIPTLFLTLTWALGFGVCLVPTFFLEWRYRLKTLAASLLAELSFIVLFFIWLKSESIDARLLIGGACGIVFVVCKIAVRALIK